MGVYKEGIKFASFVLFLLYQLSNLTCVVEIFLETWVAICGKTDWWVL